ncbi:glycoside hydrolase family 31 protein [Trematosphaeria pertusa]|uniref:alpha-glucosidase n=1 Tax=Trematosphaeria pertusa TaxID=390896 RepID=A0A6A6IUE1_9PLEO|nr:glycoside hydrolase family 31 protein [Trematosphaeria pertusa]KAF2253828.1 glycoside hydrolase family 31 protein [Trematosphaeria pertusa]
MSRPARYDFKTRPLAHPDAIVAGEKYRFTVLTDGLLRVEWAEDGRFEDRASTFAINRKLAVPDFYVWDRGDVLEIVTRRFHVVYNKQKFSPEGFVIHLKGAVSAKWTYGQPVSNLGGTTRTLDGVDGRTNLGKGVLSREGSAVLDDTKTMLFESDGWIAPRRAGERSDEYIFLYGHDYREAMRAFYAVSGSQPLLPRFAMGNWWSRYHAYDEKEYLELHDHFEKDDVPMNVAVVDMDWHLVWNVPGGLNGWTGYTWNKELFPDPDAFMKKLHDRGMKLTLNLHPADGIRWYEEQYPEVAKYLGIDPATKRPAEFDCTSRDFMDAYFDIVHHQHEARGVDFWWVDWQQGNTSKIPGVDPLWVLNHFHFLDIGRGRQRPLILSRFGGPGAQRYQVGFSGDAIITWNSLHFQPEFTSTASNIGYGWWSNDIGGHTHGYKDDELTARWVQLGCWSPILRLHSDNNPFNTREPWRFNDEACKVMEDTLRLRHRLIPYLYTMNARSASDDEPLVQPMYWDYPEHEEAYNVPNQFRFGSELIVSPVTQPRDKGTHLAATKAWLPPGRFADIFTGLVYDGGRELQLHRPLHLTPVLAPEGAIIPLDAAHRPKSGSPNPEALEILLVVGADGSFDLIEDDGTGTSVDDGGFQIVESNNLETQASEAVRFITTPITYKQSVGVIKIGPTYPAHDPSIPKSRDWKIRLIAHTLSSPTPEIRCITTTSSKRAKALQYTTTAVENGTLISLNAVPTSQSCIVELGSSGPQLDVLDPNPRILDIVDKASMLMDRKWDIKRIVERNDSLNVKVSNLQRMAGNGDFSQELLGAVLEVLLADSRYASGSGAFGVDREFEMC